MENNLKILGEALKDWTFAEQTTFLTASNDEELKKIIKSQGFNYPDRDLAYFKTIYLECDKLNKNNMMVPLEAAKKGIDTLAGKIINFDHLGKFQICGFVLQGKIEGNFVVAYCALFKGAFKEEFPAIQKLFEDKKLFVSFEIHRTNDKGEDILIKQKDGTYLVSEVCYSGVGLLLREKPACAKARVLDLLAKQEVIDAEKIVDKIFRKQLSSNIIYAEMFEDQNCKKCAICTCSKEEEKVMEDTELKARAVKVGLPETATKEEVEAKEAELVVVPAKAEPPVVAQEPNPVAPVVPAPEVTPAVVALDTVPAERKMVQVLNEFTGTLTTDYTDGKSTTAGKRHNKTTYRYSDGTKNTEEHDDEVTDSYTQAQVEAKIKEVSDAKDEEFFGAAPKEVIDCVKEKTKGGMKMGEALKTCWADYKDKQTKAMADEVGKRETEIANLKADAEVKKTENDTLKAEVETLKGKKVAKDTKLAASVKGNDDPAEENVIGKVAGFYREQQSDKAK
jgi:hypothetical protein